MQNDIKGINKILKLESDFKWHQLNYIESFNYYIDFNDIGEEVSYLNIKFLIEDTSTKIKKVIIKFSGVIGFDVIGIGGSYNQIMGFEIIDQKNKGWESDNRYLINDYEDGRIKLFCRSIEIVSIIKR